jgi:hypothetical protein
LEEKKKQKNFHFDSCEQFSVNVSEIGRARSGGRSQSLSHDKKNPAKLLNKTVKLHAFVWKLIAVERSIDCLVKRIRFSHD